MATDDLPSYGSDESWDTGHPALLMDRVPKVPRTFPQYTWPFKACSDISRDYPGDLEVIRFQWQREQGRAFMWTCRRSHAPWDKAIPLEWGLDAIYLRHEGERAYCERLDNLQAQTAPPRLAPELIFFSEPWIQTHVAAPANALSSDIRPGVFEYSIRRIRILKKWKNSIRIRIRRIRIRIGKLEFDSREL
jgi:hypothetical protein